MKPSLRSGAHQQCDLGELTLLSRFISFGLYDFLRVLPAPRPPILNQTLIMCKVKYNKLNLKDGMLTEIVKKLTRQHRNRSLHNAGLQNVVYTRQGYVRCCVLLSRSWKERENKENSEIASGWSSLIFWLPLILLFVWCWKIITFGEAALRVLRRTVCLGVRCHFFLLASSGWSLSLYGLCHPSSKWLPKWSHLCPGAWPHPQPKHTATGSALTSPPAGAQRTYWTRGSNRSISGREGPWCVCCSPTQSIGVSV